MQTLPHGRMMPWAVAKWATAGNVFVMLLFAFGSVPFIGGALGFVLGPGLVVLGSVVLVLGVTELGAAISP